MNDSDFSIERMVEIATSLSMGALFAKSMNNAYINSVSRLNNNQLNEPPRLIYAIIDGKQQGPFSEGEVLELIRQEAITQESYIWKPGMTEWMKARDVDTLKPTLNVQIPKPPQ